RRTKPTRLRPSGRSSRDRILLVARRIARFVLRRSFKSKPTPSRSLLKRHRLGVEKSPTAPGRPEPHPRKDIGSDNRSRVMAPVKPGRHITTAPMTASARSGEDRPRADPNDKAAFRCTDLSLVERPPPEIGMEPRLPDSVEELLFELAPGR